ncbi:MAG: protein-L-isoaspartate O-methyltransferase [Rhodospirillales bacterium]|nr:protein-L-isoaspartate O-methyltransferase [Rhodospirillales bacterium]MBT4041564.1 protein-L-isoaspartate O-methyltransferase [Rhodospirillales bacterium]MBT4627675.1 protein-L-isoaspartate O-methyltransferase [Rhodospirillales bacterium]MBT5351608.1 protein-L-isoaspartate O-methyltransferase [Rhodospirillales bacterium]MBT5519257.1 protein-L-isoaspartate O-methyltransferase [Rhodospirillales bacterium]
MDYAKARRHMVDSQILPNRVTDPRIIAAMESLPREAFVPEDRKGVAYVDEAIPVGNGRHLMEPMVVARLLQTAEPNEDDVALVVGSATGYTAAVLAKMISAVVVVESDAGLVAQASSTLSELGIDNVAVMEGALSEGYPKQAPYDLIIFDGAVAEVPQSIQDQLAEGGRLVAVVGGLSHGMLGSAVVMSNFHGAVSARAVFEAGTPPLPGFTADQAFSF